MPEEVYLALLLFDVRQIQTQIKINNSIINAITEINDLYHCGAIGSRDVIEAFRCLGIE